MNKFEVFPLRESAVMYIKEISPEINFNPPYQRAGDVWTLSKKQLLIDSIINSFDIPKIYFHEVRPQGTFESYAVIDGKQRLTAILDFMSGHFPLSDDFTYLQDPSIVLAGKSYDQIAKDQLRIRIKFDSTPLPIFVVRTEEEGLIEEMFTRLNEAMPLSSAERRTAFAGPIPRAMTELTSHTFFETKIPFKNYRSRYTDIACKFIYLIHANKVVDLKKGSLDGFVRNFAKQHKSKEDSEKKATELCTKAKFILTKMSTIFNDDDILLKQVGMLYVYFSLFMQQPALLETVERPTLEEFEAKRKTNRELIEKNEDAESINYELLEFDRLTQSPNDAYAIEFKLNSIKSFLQSKGINA